jgi:Mrp family chromosome partitioning ATPase
MFRGFVAFQVRLLESLNATHLALESDAWRSAGGTLSPTEIAAFVERRTILHEFDTHHVRIQFSDPVPERALAGVRALIEAYEKLSAEENAKDERLAFATTQTEVFTAQLKDVAGQMLKITSEYGGVEGLEMRHRAAVEQVLLAEQELQRLGGEMRALEGTAAPAAPLALSPGEIAVESPHMAESLLKLDLLQAEAARVAETLGEHDNRRIGLAREIEVRRNWISQFADDWNRRRGAVKPIGLTAEEVKGRKTAMEERASSLREQSQALGNKRVELGKRQAESADLERRLDQMKALKDQLAAQLIGKGRIKIADAGRLPTSPISDRRKTFAAMGGVLGSMTGVLLVLLLGVRDRRFRGTDDVGTDLSRLRLLGLMPTLPADLSEPRNREIAVHCVHQVRTLLQIGSARDGGSSICITGPGVGTGKTTLTLALGLSFGGSGSRTLLVDADLSGSGLTRRVGRMLFAHLRRLTDGNGGIPVREADGPCPEYSRQFLEPLVQERSPRSRVEAEEVLETFSKAVGRMGLAAARASGLVDQLFAVVDLLFAGGDRAALVARLETALDAEAKRGNEPPVARGPRRAELRSDRSYFNGDPLERYLYPTGIPALQFLPLRGLGTGGAVSAATVSTILDRVRSEFDVALVDTGPVLGAVEAPMVAAHSDAVLLVVSPSDDRREAERVVAHLEDVGTRIAGVVFNRAGSRDVLRSSRSRSSGFPEPGVT